MNKKVATRDAYGEALAALAAENPNLVVLDADLSGSTKTSTFAKAAPERFFNCGIAEGNMMSVAAGLAAAGKTPFVSSFAVFATGRGFEQIRNSICYPKLGVKIAATHAGITVGEDGGSHQAIEDISLMRSLPNMTVLVPADEAATLWAIREAAAIQGPVYIRLGRLAAPCLYCAEQKFQLGKANLVKAGSDITIFACGLMVSAAVEAAALLADEGIKAAVADIHSIKPLDSEFIIDQAKSTGAAITVEEHSIIGGLGSAVAETLAEAGIGIPFQRVGLEDKFGQSGSPDALLRFYGLDAEAIAAKAKVVLAAK